MPITLCALLVLTAYLLRDGDWLGSALRLRTIKLG